ncbi:hypothetical protein QBC32DRAFT_316997 [Pseudoneurospora amorphoporcata]|uniref:Uncharacterized protein n=1 Tax=Pseudoneurospora amorphoporcata TaxID=241081 RepID=A0AAN6NNS4_9PEZI|nr:hypothetical protein QBC32DRAFT_316997 [Pseudoneurospora amorphoporcata]
MVIDSHAAELMEGQRMGDTAIVQAVDELLTRRKEVIIRGYADIIETTDVFAGKDQSSGPGEAFNDEECTAVSGAYHRFASVNQATLKVLIGKVGLTTGLPFRAPMSAVLRGLGVSYDDTPRKNINTDSSSLSKTITEAGEAYDATNVMQTSIE